VRLLFATARKDLLRLRSDWPAMLLWIGVPLLVGGLLVLVFGGDARPRARLLVDDRDGSLAGRLLTGGFTQGPLAEIVEVEGVETDEGFRRMEDGDASALLVIPAGFGEALLDGRPASLELVTNPAQSILPGILHAALDIELEAAEVLRRLFDAPIARIAADEGRGGALSDSLVASVAAEFHRAGEGARGWLLPPAIDLETVEPPDEETFDFGRAFFPGMLILALLFMATGLSVDVWAERRLGTLERAIVTPGGVGTFVAGKWLAGAAALALVAAIGLAAGRWAFGIEIANPALAFAWLALVGVALLAAFTLVQVLARSERAANVLVNAVTLPLAMLGGSFFPFETMPGWMVALGKATPNGWALLRLRAIVDGAPEPRLLAVSAVGVVALLVAGCWLVTRRIRGWTS
jgi:ABC-type Na+ efflux pump permease subunit